MKKPLITEGEKRAVLWLLLFYTVIILFIYTQNLALEIIFLALGIAWGIITVGKLLEIM